MAIQTLTELPKCVGLGTGIDPERMKINEIAFSCYPVTDMARARAFYEGILGLAVTMDHEMEEGHWVEYDIGHGTLAIGNMEGMIPSREGCSVALEVEDFDAAVSELEQANVEFRMWSSISAPTKPRFATWRSSAIRMATRSVSTSGKSSTAGVANKHVSPRSDQR